MNKTLKQMEALFENGILTEAEYKMHKHMYMLHKATVMEIEEATQDRFNALCMEKIAREESECCKDRVKTTMRERKILDLYAKGRITEEGVNQLLGKEYFTL